jgi:galactokinase
VDRGIPLAGAHIWIGGDLAVGAGLSRSASLELAVAHALLAASGHSIGGSGSELADICRMAEHRYAGVPCGIMDQLVCATAVADAALLIDCRDRSSRAIGWLDADVTAVVVDSGSRHRLSGGTYAQRVAECRAALDHYHVRDPSIRSLRDLTEEALISMRGDLDDTLFRRARHVVSEIQRTSSAAEALAAGEFSSLGRLLNASHESLRVDYEVSSGQLDDLAACVRSVTGVYGARLTGAGFGGCVVALAERGSLEALDATVRNEYARRYGVDARVIPTRACAGASVEIL